ncbi:hypothetical protein J2128_000067 [Methanomicrobium sp. W14]|nr:hypothetical protein [Methanomicrobium sp. W14]
MGLKINISHSEFTVSKKGTYVSNLTVKTGTKLQAGEYLFRYYSFFKPFERNNSSFFVVSDSSAVSGVLRIIVSGEGI